MEWISNEMLYYGGIAIAVTAILAALIFFLTSRMSRHRLDERLNEEYGKSDS